VSIQFEDAGHILGSTAVLLEADQRRILYTGDVNFHDQTLMAGAKLPEENIDTLDVSSARAARSPSPKGLPASPRNGGLQLPFEKFLPKAGACLCPFLLWEKARSFSR
jgi:predicted metal-dependent RNase